MKGAGEREGRERGEGEGREGRGLSHDRVGNPRHATR